MLDYAAIMKKYNDVEHEDIEAAENYLETTTAQVNSTAKSAAEVKSTIEIAKHAIELDDTPQRLKDALGYMLEVDMIEENYYDLYTEDSTYNKKGDVEFIGRGPRGNFPMKRVEENKKIVEDYLYKNKKVCKTNILKLLRMCGDFGVYTNKLKDKVLVDLPEDNVGPIYVEPEYKDIMFKINDLTNDIYNYMNAEGNEDLLDRYDCAGFEIFGTICSLLNIKYQDVERDE